MKILWTFLVVDIPVSKRFKNADLKYVYSKQTQFYPGLISKKNLDIYDIPCFIYTSEYGRISLIRPLISVEDHEMSVTDLVKSNILLTLEIMNQ